MSHYFEDIEKSHLNPLLSWLLFWIDFTCSNDIRYLEKSANLQHWCQNSALLCNSCFICLVAWVLHSRLEPQSHYLCSGLLSHLCWSWPFICPEPVALKLCTHDQLCNLELMLAFSESPYLSDGNFFVIIILLTLFICFFLLLILICN